MTKREKRKFKKRKKREERIRRDNHHKRLSGRVRGSGRHSGRLGLLEWMDIVLKQKQRWVKGAKVF